VINQERLVKTFLQLVQIDSPSGFEGEVRTWIKDKLEKMGLEHEVDKAGNLYCKLKSKGDPVVISGHMDTVEPGRGIEPIIEAGIIKSSSETILGADNKANLAGVIEVIRVLKNNNIKHKPIEIVMSVEEEPGLKGVKRFDFNKLDSNIGICFDKAAPVGTIVNKSPSCLHIDGKVIGKSAHAGGEPTKGINALHAFVHVVSDLKLGRIDPETTANIGTVKAGNCRNSIPETVEFKGEIRSHSEQDLEKIYNTWINTFSSVTSSIEASFEHSVKRQYSRYFHDENSTLIKALTSTFSSLNIETNLVPSGGASDANIFNTHGIQVADLGCGQKHPHRKDESISVENLKKMSEVILEFVTKS